MNSQQKRSAAIVTFGLAILGVIATVLTWRFPWPPDKRPALYALRVQVLDPNGAPVRAATVSTSASNEPHLLPDGWWEIQIPRAKVPEDNRLVVWAEHPDWATGRAVVSLADDAQPRLELRLGKPAGIIPGIVLDSKQRGVEGVRVGVLEYAVPAVTTDRDGRFRIALEASSGTKVTVHVEDGRHSPQQGFCYVGSACPIYLQEP